MRAYILRRLLLVPLIVVLVSIITFSLVRILPGDAAVARLGAQAGSCEQCLEAARKELGLDKSYPEQYWNWFKNAIRGDFGLSTATTREIGPELKERSLVTLQLGLITIVFTILIGVPIGVISAVKAGRPTDYGLRFFSILGLSVPNFWIATLIVYLPAYYWQWNPAKKFTTISEDPLSHFSLLLLPALVLAISASAYVARITRSAMLESLASDHVRTARAKGLAERVVVFEHVFRNSLIPLLSVVGLQFGLILGGSIIIEDIFGIPGMGQMAGRAVFDRDYQTVQAVAVVISTTFVLITLLVDVAYAWVDPRIRY
ncbi:MAG: ABC transporter permease [Dehalococcoidia bacterium]|nr:ABC transporter permease [Dehalococcoidia bacterium]